MKSVAHDLVLVCFLHLPEQLEDLHQIFLETAEDPLGVLASAFMFMKTVHAVRNRVLRKLNAWTTYVVMVYINHAELRLKLHRFGEKCHKLV